MTTQTKYLFNTPEPTADPIDRLFDAEVDGCQNCSGRGVIFNMTRDPQERWDIDCPICSGTGRSNPNL